MGSHATCSGAWVSGPEDISPPEYFWGYNRMLTVEGLFGAGDTVGVQHINSHLAHLLKAELQQKLQLSTFRILVMKKFRSVISSVMTLKKLFSSLWKTTQLVVMRLQLEQFHQVTCYQFKDFNALKKLWTSMLVVSVLII